MICRATEGSHRAGSFSCKINVTSCNFAYNVSEGAAVITTAEAQTQMEVNTKWLKTDSAVPAATVGKPAVSKRGAFLTAAVTVTAMKMYASVLQTAAVT